MTEDLIVVDRKVLNAFYEAVNKSDKPDSVKLEAYVGVVKLLINNPQYLESYLNKYGNQLLDKMKEDFINYIKQ